MSDIKFTEGKFYIGDINHPDAELTYKPKNDTTIIADHTFVDEKLRGEGIAGQLFQKLIKYARDNHLKIIPECPYIEKKMTRTDEYDDVLAK